MSNVSNTLSQAAIRNKINMIGVSKEDMLKEYFVQEAEFKGLQRPQTGKF